MKTFVKIALIGVVLVGTSAAAYKPTVAYMKKRNMPDWRQAEVVRGRIVSVVNSTGTIKPTLSVAVGAFVSGPVQDLFVEFNQEVKKDDLLARIDPRIYEATASQNRAALASRLADVQRAQAVLQQAINNEKRAIALREEDETFVAQQEMDSLKFTRMSFEAQLKLAEASVKQAQATLDFSELQIEYTDIKSPVDGIVINRKIDRGNTVAVQFQTPELFIIAPDMRQKMHVHASVDEADIGLIKAAQTEGQKVVFTVDAYPDDIFSGTIEEVRLNSTTTQNVVTYPVVVAAPNPELKLLPGMTASISFQVDERDKVVKLPNAALRFYPTLKQVREKDRPLLEGVTDPNTASDDENSEQSEQMLSAEERAELRRKRNRRHVWVADGEFLRAVEVVTGISDSRYTELISGDLEPGQQLVIGVKPKKPFGT